MPILDRAVDAAIGLGMAKLSGGANSLAHTALNLAKRAGILPSFLDTRNPLTAGRARTDPLMSYNWYCDLPTIDGTSLGWEFVEEATLPLVEFEPMSNYRAGKMYHYAGHYSIGTLNLKLYEDSRGSAVNYLDAWQRRIINLESGLYNVPRDYKQTVKFTILDVAKLTVMFVEYTGCWPTRPDSISLNSGSSDRVILSVELSVDEMRLKFGKFEKNHVPSIIDIIGTDFPPKLSSLPMNFPGNFVDLTIGGLGANNLSNSVLNAARGMLGQ